MNGSIEVQQEALEKLIIDAATLTNNQRKVYIPDYYSKTGLKTQIIYCIINMREALGHRRDPLLRATFDELKTDFLIHVQKRIVNLGKIPEELAGFRDLVFACHEVAKLSLNDWSESCASEVTQFQGKILPSLIDTMRCSNHQTEIYDSFKHLKEAIESQNFQLIDTHLNAISNLIQDVDQ